jgi:hypothetical protein
MKRVYDQGDDIADVSYFVGSEVEHTPQFGAKTLFVVGLKDPEQIMGYAEEHGCKHIYCGANMSWQKSEEWDTMVLPLLKANFWVTLDFPISDIEWVLESGYTEYNRFIPMLSVKVPYIDQLGYNACIKLDDKDFDSTNPGVWVHKVHDLKTRSTYTDWSKYTTDTIIG